MDFKKCLERMGNSWFVLYYYYKHIDSSELRWKNCGTVDLRIREFERTEKALFHNDYLGLISRKPASHLGAKGLGVAGKEVLEMVKKIRG